MKKIATLIVLVTLLASTLAAQELNWNVWLETIGSASIKNGKNLADDEKAPTTSFGETTAQWELSISGDGYGAHATLGAWADVGALGLAPPKFSNTYMWSNLGIDILKLYAGLSMAVLDYTPAPAVEGGLYFNSSFGNGLGIYNHQGDYDYTEEVTGLIAEVNVAGFSGALALRAGKDLLEDHLKSTCAIINLKYDADIVTAFGGFAVREDNHGLWIAASTNIVDGLLADVKYETNIAKDSKNMIHNIALNLGYRLGFGRIATETNLSLGNKDNEEFLEGAGASLGYSVSSQIIPFAVPVVDPTLDILISGNDAKNSSIEYAVALNLSKSIGIITNTLRIGYNSSIGDNPVGDLKFQYAINMWY